MSSSLFTIYSMDTSVFLTAYKTYPFDLFPGWWEWIDRMTAQGQIFLCQMAFLEIKRHTEKGDAIYQWAQKQKKTHPRFVREEDEAVFTRAEKIAMNFPELSNRKKIPTADADPYVIAHAMVTNAIVVTEEKSTNSPKPRKIPDVCQKLNIKCINTHDFMRQEGVNF